MSKKVAIITGCSSGFGLMSALELAQSGFQVVATMRDPNKSTELLTQAEKEHVKEHITVFPLDVTSKESIEGLMEYIKSLPSVDVLVNNAGFAVGGFCEELTIEDYQEQFDTNFFGVISVTKAVLPYMREQQSGRMINISSISGRIGFPGLSPYVSSKFALEGFSEALSFEVAPFGIDVVLVEPGSYETSIWSTGTKLRTDHSSREDSPYYFYLKAILKNLHKAKPKYGDPREVARLVASIASQKTKPALRYPVGKGVKTSIRLKHILPSNQMKSIVTKKLLGSKVGD
ncbi:SDR family oxidoreductase [Bacillus salitolerans]|uniref:SDR family oxidoreductase n=1 Tax=Bacillus salitolerans TaxID=1437434 RepID=A0ABW4LV27_9BACI